MDENEVEVMADDLFDNFAEALYSLPLKDTIAVAEVMETKIQYYIDGLSYDVRNRR